MLFRSEPLTKKYNVIISNPPYIAFDEEINEDVKANEPHLALYAPDDGLYFYKEIIANSNEYLTDPYLLAFEIGHMQGEKLTSFANEYFPKHKIIVEKDLQGRDRFLFIYKNI